MTQLELPLGHPWIADTGKREEVSGGMVREPSGDRTDYTLTLDGPMFDRWARHVTAGAKKYSPRNWMKAINGSDEDIAKAIQRARESAFRHFVAWMQNKHDEDHAAAVFFNINQVEYLEGNY